MVLIFDSIIEIIRLYTSLIKFVYFLTSCSSWRRNGTRLRARYGVTCLLYRQRVVLWSSAPGLSSSTIKLYQILTMLILRDASWIYNHMKEITSISGVSPRWKDFNEWKSHKNMLLIILQTERERISETRENQTKAPEKN